MPRIIISIQHVLTKVRVVREVIKIYKKQNWAQNTSLWNPLITYKLWLANFLFNLYSLMTITQIVLEEVGSILTKVVDSQFFTENIVINNVKSCREI